ncbi:hypothetical protein [Actinomadura sp. 9N407]|uniref:hypothetical protein n=1 Tax=Actinomadura sp. 9N407 TaxID=3375154 RepID=UPI0037B5A8B1
MTASQRLLGEGWCGFLLGGELAEETEPGEDTEPLAVFVEEVGAEGMGSGPHAVEDRS